MTRIRTSNHILSLSATQESRQGTPRPGARCRARHQLTRRGPRPGPPRSPVPTLHVDALPCMGAHRHGFIVPRPWGDNPSQRNPTRTSPTQTISTRSVSLYPRGGPRGGALVTPVLLLLLVSLVGHASNDLHLNHYTISGLFVAPDICCLDS